jgi:signal peptidase I
MRSRSILREYLEALLIAVIFATFARTFVVQAFKIPTGSMEENLLIGDHILVNKFVYGPIESPIERRLLPRREVRRGDVVVFKFPEDPTRDFIKRCIALGGDQIEVVDKVVYVNGARVPDQDYAYHDDANVYPNSVFLHEDYRFRDNFGPATIPEGYLFFLGDNRDNSNDSRFWGPVPESYVKGRAFLVYWSFDGESVEEPEGVSGVVDRVSEVVGHFVGSTRWNRSFQVVR